MFKFSKPIIVQNNSVFGPQRKKAVSLQTTDGNQAASTGNQAAANNQAATGTVDTTEDTNSGQSDTPAAANVVLYISIAGGVILAILVIYVLYKKYGPKLRGGGQAVVGAPSTIDEEVSSILTNLSQL